MNECVKCNGWGIVFIKAGIPNIMGICPECKGVNGTVRFVDRAREIATLAHAGEYRRGIDGGTSNVAYIHHCSKVAEVFEDDPLCEAIAWLHDTMENHPDKVTRAYLEKEGMPQEVVDGVECITKKPGEDYVNDYLYRCLGIEAVRRVKVRDICVNLGDYPTQKQLRKYAVALNYLT